MRAVRAWFHRPRHRHTGGRHALTVAVLIARLITEESYA